jgi:hypothetical protein
VFGLTPSITAAALVRIPLTMLQLTVFGRPAASAATRRAIAAKTWSES